MPIRIPAANAPDVPNLGAWEELSGSILSRPGVVGCYLGRRIRGGELTTQWAVVACVERKRERSELDPHEIIPRELRWSPGGNAVARVRTDVQQIGRRVRRGVTQPPDNARNRPQPVVGPGDIASRWPAGAINCTIGLVTNHPRLGLVATTAAHGFTRRRTLVPVRYRQSPQSQVEVVLHGVAQPVQAYVRLVHFDATFDYALLQFSPRVPVANLFEDTYPLDDAHDPHPVADRNAQLCVLTARGEVPVELTGLHARVLFRGTPYEHVILTTPMTDGGDSGGVLVDEHYRPWGTLIGQFDFGGVIHAMFASAYQMVHAIHSDTALPWR